jgi:hypothetical protein
MKINNKLNIKTKNKTLDKVFDEISKKWQVFSEKDKNNICKFLAGNKQ